MVKIYWKKIIEFKIQKLKFKNPELECDKQEGDYELKTFYFFHFAFFLTQTLVMPTQEASQTVSRIIIFPTYQILFLQIQNLKVKNPELECEYQEWNS